jgi:hypothetical protein
MCRPLILFKFSILQGILSSVVIGDPGVGKLVRRRLFLRFFERLQKDKSNKVEILNLFLSLTDSEASLTSFLPLFYLSRVSEPSLQDGGRPFECLRTLRLTREAISLNNPFPPHLLLPSVSEVSSQNTRRSFGSFRTLRMT